MWREFFESYRLPCFFGEPASAAEITRLEQTLSVVVPPELRGLFSEMNGISVRPAFFDELAEDDTMQVIWTLDEVVEENRQFGVLEDNSDPAHAGLSQFLFFAHEPNGDILGYALADGGIVTPDLLVMSHEDWKDRHTQCSSLQEYLTILMETCQ